METRLAIGETMLAFKVLTLLLFRWSMRESSQIESKGDAEGWELEYLQAPAKYPELAMDMPNLVITKSGGRNRSKH